MAGKDPYKPAPKQSEIPKAVCERAAWYLNALGKDLRDNADKRKFKDVYTAYTKLNIPVMCLEDPKRSYEERRAGVRSATCKCYAPLSGLAGKQGRRKGGKPK